MQNTNENRTYKILAATGIPSLNNALERCENVNVVGSCVIKHDLANQIEVLKPQIVLLSDKLAGDENLIGLMISLKNKFKYTRFIYLTGEVGAKDIARTDALGTLVLVGIYDIVMSKKINIDLIMDIIENPKSEKEVKYLTENILNNKAEIDNSLGGMEYVDYDGEKSDVGIANNVFVFTSIKPGTGKTFVSTNVATAIARYGKGPMGRPRVAIIEADLQTLSVGTVLGIDEKANKNKNIRAAIEIISDCFDRGNLTDDEEKIKRAHKRVRDCFVKYKYLSNLDVLVGSSLTPEDIDRMDIRPEYYSFLIDILKDDYDVIVIDSNSSIFHVTTFPLLHLAKNAFYIINLDFNNVKNNMRYRETIKSLGIADKVRYVLNEDIENTKEFENQGVMLEELYFTSEKMEKDYFKLTAKIPILYKTIFLNRLYEGTPVVLDSNDVDYTNAVKYEILRLASGIYPIDDTLNKLKQKLDEKNKGGGLSAFFSNLFGKKKKKEEPEKKEEKKEEVPDE